MVYLDNSATTAVDRKVAAVAMHMMADNYFNPSSLHYGGSQALEELTRSRFQIAQLLCVPTDKVHFCSSGTEANSTAILGIANDIGFWRGKNIVVTGGEHASVLQTARSLERYGCETRTADLENQGTPDIQGITDMVDESTALVCMMAANNETGAIFPVKETAQKVKRKNPNTLFLCDLVQAFGKMHLDLSETEIDFATCSGHKIHAPKGSAALYARKPLYAQRFGGSQEKRLFPGTEDTPSWCAFGEAARICTTEMEQDSKRVENLNSKLREQLTKDSRFVINSPESALPYVLNFSVPGYDSYKVVSALSARDVFVSSGAACERGAKSHVLQSMGLSDEIVSSAIRVSFSRFSTEDDVDALLENLGVVLRSVDVQK